MDQGQSISQKTNQEVHTQSSSKFQFVLIGLVLVFGVGGVYLAKYPYGPKTKPIPQISVTPTPAPTATPTLDLTSDWVTYTNTKYEFEIKYPKPDPNDPSEKFNSYTENLLEINGLDSLVIRIEPIQTFETDPAVWWKSQKTEVYTKKPATCFAQQTATIVKSLYDPNQRIINFGKNVLILNNFRSEVSTCLEPPEVQILLVPLNGRFIKITSDWAGLSEQILSTFKFLDQTNPAVTREQATELVKSQSEVKNWLALFKSGSQGPQVVVEDEDASKYTVHVFEGLSDHLATFNWYYVNKVTGNVTKEF